MTSNIQQVKNILEELELLDKQKKLLEDRIADLLKSNDGYVKLNLNIVLPTESTNKIKVLTADGSLTPEAKGEEEEESGSFGFLDDFYKRMYGTRSTTTSTKSDNYKFEIAISLKEMLVLNEIILSNMEERRKFLNKQINKLLVE